jgi:hypothetical protein
MSEPDPREDTTTDTPREAPAAAAAADAAPERRTGRVITARVLIVVATILGIVSIFSAWAYRQLLDTEVWTDTSTQLLENKEIRDQVSTYLVDELYTSVDVTAELQNRLPGNLSPLAPVIAGGLRNALDTVADRALGNPQVQAIWTDANRAAHERFVRVIEGGGPNVQTEGGVVTLDLRRVLTVIAQRVGLPDAVVQKIPPQAASIEVLRSDELEQTQNAADLLKFLGLWLGFIVLLLYALAVWLAIGRRRQTLMFAGIGIVVTGLGALIARGLVAGAVVDDLVPSAAIQPAATAAFDIGTSLLYTLAWQAIIIGAATVLAAWLGGPSRPAVAIRRAIAPTLRERPEVAYLVVAALYLLLVVWAPIPALRRPLFLLILAVLLGFGVWLLRRQTDAEFPAGTEREGPGLRERASGALKRGGAGTTAADADAERMAKLERLVALRDGGALDDAEFAAEKAKLTGGGDAPT